MTLDEVSDGESSDVLRALGLDLVDVDGSSHVDGSLLLGRSEPEVANQADDDDDEGDKVEPVGGVA